MGKPDIRNLLLGSKMSAFAPKVAPPPPLPTPTTTTPAGAPPPNVPSATPPAKPAVSSQAFGAPVRNNTRSPSVELKKAQGVKTFSLCLFEPQVKKFGELTDFLEENLASSRLGSLAVRTALYLTEKDAAFVEAVKRVTPGKDYAKQNVQMYAADYRELRSLVTFARKSGIKRPKAATVARAVIELAQLNDAFLEEATALRERQDKRGIA